MDGGNEKRPDIPYDLALAAHAGTSFVPDERARQVISEHAETLRADYDMLLAHAPTAEKKALLDEEFERYRAGYSEKARRWLASRSRCLSVMIAGPSRFPAARMEKRNEIERRRVEELTDFRARALDAIKRKLHPEWRPIMSGDADATERLEDKIAKAEKHQELMKAVNGAIRKHAGREAQVAALAELGLSAGVAEKLLTPDFCGRIGFPSFELTNNNANIRRMRERLESVTRNQAMPETVREGAAARVEDCPAENRIRLFFPGKPAREIIDDLKRNGWRWTPSLMCWQAYRHPHTLAFAEKMAGIEQKA